jgi:hypothetical protein
VGNVAENVVPATAQGLAFQPTASQQEKGKPLNESATYRDQPPECFSLALELGIAAWTDSHARRPVRGSRRWLARSTIR